MKKKVLLMMMSMFLLTGCTFSTTPPFIRGEGPMFGGSGAGSYAYNNQEEKKSEPVKEEKKTEPAKEEKKTEPAKEEKKEQKQSEKTQTTITTDPVDMSNYATNWGTDEYGYVNIDDYWVDFGDEEYGSASENMVQYATVGPVANSVYMITLAAYHTTADYAVTSMVDQDKADPNVTKINQVQAGDLYKDGAHINMYYSVTNGDDYTNLCVIICTDRANSDEVHYFAFELVDENGGDVNESIFASKYKEILNGYSEIKIIQDLYPTVDLTEVFNVVG